VFTSVNPYPLKTTKVVTTNLVYRSAQEPDRLLKSIDSLEGTSINSNLIENSYGRAALSAFVRLQ
jgi:hypothetical protein